MAVTVNDVRHIAALARLGIGEDRALTLVGELNTILDHMDVLSRVDTTSVEPLTGIGVASAPLGADAGPSISLQRSVGDFAPQALDGFFLVPRLATHEDDE